MFVFVFIAAITMAHAGVIPHHHEISHYPHSHGQATSYQSVKISNYHPVPVYVKKEHQHLLAHPVEAGHTATAVQVHHGGQRGHGQAYQHQEAGEGAVHQVQGGERLQEAQQLQGYEEQEQQEGYHGYGGQEEYGQHQQQGHEALAPGSHEQYEAGSAQAYQSHNLQGQDLQDHHLQDHQALQGQGLQAYATHYDHGHVAHQGYEQEAPEYEQAVEDDAQQHHYRQ